MIVKHAHLQQPKTFRSQLSSTLHFFNRIYVTPARTLEAKFQNFKILDSKGLKANQIFRFKNLAALQILD
jgi:hypothetical protein